MLRELQIQNLAIIDDLKLEFDTGLNILSGETGAGKSIIVNSVALILGSRSDVDMIRTGFDQGLVAASFDLKNCPEIFTRLETRGVTFDLNEPLVVKRVLSRSGKNRVYINGQLANVSLLQEVTEGLVDISSQHEFHRLMNPNSHVRILDAYGGLGELRQEYQERVKEMHHLLQQIRDLSMNESERVRQIDFLRFQINEIQLINPQADEDVALENERKLLMSAQERLKFIEESTHTLSEQEGSLLERLSHLLDRATDMTGLDEAFDSVRRCVETAQIQLDEAVQELRRLAKGVDCDEGRLEEISQRLSEIRSLMRKYGPAILDVQKFKENSEMQLNQLESRESTLRELQEQLEVKREEAMALGLSLSQKRRKISEVFTASVEAELQDLGLEHAHLSAVFSPLEAKRKFGADGVDRVHFEVSLNPGEPPKDLTRFASGGELSRILLGMKNVIAGRGEISVYLFDEVDAGIGGRTALQVGQKLASVAQHNQVICITHLPQVAAFAEKHFQVQKLTQNGRTNTVIHALELDEQTQELTRMVGGEELGGAAHQHAEELLRSAQNKRMELRRREL